MSYDVSMGDMHNTTVVVVTKINFRIHIHFLLYEHAVYHHQLSLITSFILIRTITEVLGILNTMSYLRYKINI